MFWVSVSWFVHPFLYISAMPILLWKKSLAHKAPSWYSTSSLFPKVNSEIFESPLFFWTCECFILKTTNLGQPGSKRFPLLSSSSLVFDLVNNGWSWMFFTHFRICRLFWGILFCSWCCWLVHLFSGFTWTNLTLRRLWNRLLLLVLK